MWPQKRGRDLEYDAGDKYPAADCYDLPGTLNNARTRRATPEIARAIAIATKAVVDILRTFILYIHLCCWSVNWKFDAPAANGYMYPSIIPASLL